MPATVPATVSLIGRRHPHMLSLTHTTSPDPGRVPGRRGRAIAIDCAMDLPSGLGGSARTPASYRNGGVR